MQFFNDEIEMSNALFRCCKLYINTDMFREICFALSCIYRHILGPFLIATGALKTKRGHPLDHTEFLEYYPLLENKLVSLVSDPSPLRLHDSFQEFTKFGVYNFDSRHEKMFKAVYESFKTDAHRIKQVELIHRLICEGYLTALRRQVGNFYLQSTGVICKILKEDEEALKGVPTTALYAEHQVADMRRSFRDAPCKSIRAQSARQIVTTSPYLQEL